VTPGIQTARRQRACVPQHATHPGATFVRPLRSDRYSCRHCRPESFPPDFGRV